LNALSQTVKIVEGNRARFSNIDDEELDSRREFAAETQALLTGYEKTLNSPETKEKRSSDKSKVEALRKMAAEAEERDAFAESPRDTDPMARRKQKQQYYEEKQDLVLDDMSTALSRLGLAADHMKEELADHKRLISEMDEQVNIGKDRMGDAMDKLNKLLGTSGSGKLCTIFIMILMVIILLALAILG
jgi:hypothetical protein